MAQNPTLTQVVVEMIGAAIKFPQQINATSFLPNAISINNRSASTIQVGPGVNGPFILMGQFTLAQLPWTYGRSVWVQEVGGPAAHIATEFVQVTFLGVSPASAVGAGNITSYAPSGWGSVGPGNSLANINAGDPFNFGQVQQFVNLLTGVMTGQLVNVANTIEVSTAAGQFAALDQDGIGGDFSYFFLQNGILRIGTSVGGDTLNIVESGWKLLGQSASFVLQDTLHSINALFYSSINNSMGFPGKLNPGSSDGVTQVNSGIYAGNGVPSNANGINGDFFFRGDGAAGTFIYHKAAGAWTAFA